ncbi:ubiquitin carboxyl-terminal hydrolase [Ceratobasidium sp. AG-Ba]|nr:ubiquitin carboxyl-terminal hydrolase [Ceratobasidium sp. AG-Ba]
MRWPLSTCDGWTAVWTHLRQRDALPTPTPMVEASPGSPQLPSLKRARSDTAASGSMSPKRANSEVVEEDIGAGGHRDDDIDHYMQLQDEGNEADIGLTPMAALDEPTPDGSLTAQERFQMIKNLEKMPLEIGAIWYVVDRRWMRLWEAAIIGGGEGLPGPNEQTIGPVDNSSIIHPGTLELLPDLALGEDYALVPEAAWQKFAEWYGKPATSLPREVIPFTQTELRIEVYPPVFRVYPLLAHNASSPVPSSRVDISSLLHLSVLAARAATSLQLPTDQPYRVWNIPSQTNTVNGVRASDIERGTLVPISPDSKTPISQFAKISDILVVETQVSGQWLLDADAVTLATDTDANAEIDEPLFPRNNDWIGNMQNRHASNVTRSPDTLQPPRKSAFSGLSFRGKSPVPAIQRGTMGLQNLGNTCFMNSALQCLAHIPELDEYFLSGLYRHELNPDNPLGMQGQIANAFGALLHHLYPGSSTAPPPKQERSYSAWGFGGGSSSSSYAPREFKQTLGRFAPAFSGYQQHDTQEFLGFLLDGLHEDLNRVLKKPYVEKPEWPEEGGGREVEARLATETWEGYKKRNDSIIVDLFQGMYKSTLVCPECAKVSITFDPFMYLTLPLPITKTWRHTVHYVPWDTHKPALAVQIEVPKDSSYGYLKKIFGRWFGVEPENLLAAEVWSHKFYKYYDDYMNLTDLAEKDVLIVFELPVPLKSAALPTPTHYNRFSKLTAPKLNPDAPFILPVFNTAVNQRTPFGVPFLVVLSAAEACSRRAIYRAVVDRVQRWTKLKADLWKYRGARNILRPDAEPELELDEVITTIDPVGQEEAAESVTEIRVDQGGDVEPNVAIVPASTPTDVEMADTPHSEAGETLASDVAPTVTSEIAPTVSSESVQPSQDADGEEDPYEVLGPQEELFDLKIYNSGMATAMETGFNLNPSINRFVDWASREPRVEDVESEGEDDQATSSSHSRPIPARPLVKATDALVCHWQPTFADHFFSSEDNLFDRWDNFVHAEVEAVRAAQTKSRSGKQAVDIEDCLDEFTKEEQLGEDDLWYCPRCKKHQQATKKFELWSVPDILVVHLKRFSNARAMRDKIDALVDFPIEGLDLGRRVGALGADGEEAKEGEYVYDLFAVDEHMGGLGGGHYRAYAKNPSDGEWYHFDDSYVSKSSAEDSVNANAYLLFYRRRAAIPNAVIDNVRERIGSAQNSPALKIESKAIDMSEEPVARANSPFDTELPSFEASTYDTLVPAPNYDRSAQYRSQGSEDPDDDPFTNTNASSPVSGSVGSTGVAYDSSEDKDFTESTAGLNSKFALSGPVTEVAVTVVQESEQDIYDNNKIV